MRFWQGISPVSPCTWITTWLWPVSVHGIMPKITEHLPSIKENAFMNYFFLYCRRQWASFSDLLILFSVLGLCQWDMLSFNPLREKHTYLCSCSSYKENFTGLCRTVRGPSTQLKTQVQLSSSCHPAMFPIKQDIGTEPTRKEMSFFLQLFLFHSISAYIKLFCCYDMLLNYFWNMLTCLVKTVVRGLFCSVYLKVYHPMEFGKLS